MSHYNLQWRIQGGSLGSTEPPFLLFCMHASPASCAHMSAVENVLPPFKILDAPLIRRLCRFLLYSPNMPAVHSHQPQHCMKVPGPQSMRHSYTDYITICQSVRTSAIVCVYILEKPSGQDRIEFL